MRVQRLETVDGFIVFDLDDAGISAGGTRLAPDVTEDEVALLARAMTYKFAVLGQRMGGAKAGVRATVADRDDAMARYCDEINIDVDLVDMPETLAVLHDRCGEIGRDPKTLMVSTGTNPAWPYPGLRVIGKQRMMTPADLPAILKADFSKLGTRAEELAGWRELGMDRVTCGVPGLADTDEGLYELIEDCRMAGLAITPPAPAAAG